MSPEYPVAFVFNELLCGISSTAGRLLELAASYDRDRDQYSHAKLMDVLDPEAMHKAFSAAHILVWRRWIQLSLAQQLADLRNYLQSSPQPPSALFTHSLRHRGGTWHAQILAPLNVPQAELELAASNLFVLGFLFSKDSRPVHPSISHILGAIHEAYADPRFSLASVSNTVGLSERQVARLLKQHTGDTFTQYVRRMRLESARELLINSNARVKAICAMVGYKEINWFNRYFRAATGYTPSQFRKRAAF